MLIDCVILLKNQYCYWRREKDKIVFHLNKSIKVEMLKKFPRRNNYIERISLVWRLSWRKFQHQKSITILSVLSLFCLFPLEIYFCGRGRIKSATVFWIGKLILFLIVILFFMLGVLLMLYPALTVKRRDKFSCQQKALVLSCIQPWNMLFNIAYYILSKWL